MNSHTSFRSMCVLAAVLASIGAAWPVAAADAGGMRQQPLEPPPRGADRPQVPGPGTSSRGGPPGGMQRPSEDRPASTRTSITFRGTRYVVTSGHWYEQRGDDLVAVAPPLGVLVQKLPDGYAMRWIGGVPYFYADGLYYVWRERQKAYEILQTRPAEEPDSRPELPRAAGEGKGPPR